MVKSKKILPRYSLRINTVRHLSGFISVFHSQVKRALFDRHIFFHQKLQFFPTSNFSLQHIKNTIQIPVDDLLEYFLPLC